MNLTDNCCVFLTNTMNKKLENHDLTFGKIDSISVTAK